MEIQVLLLLHGAVGNLDELLVCGAGIALVLVIIFVVELFARRKEGEAPNPKLQIPNPDQKSETLKEVE